MACSTISLASSSASIAAAYAPLSSASAPFVASSAPAMLSPISSPSSLKSFSISCNHSEKEAPAYSMRKAILTGIVATGAALSVFAADTASPPAFAAVGPGSSGGERTAQKAQDLLKAADKLNVEDAPQRYGPGRVSGSGPEDASKVAQDAGGKALSKIQDGISSIAGDLGGKKGDVQSAAENVASQAQNKVEDATGSSGPGGLFSSIKERFQGIKDSVEQKDAAAKKTLDEAASNVQSNIQ